MPAQYPLPALNAILLRTRYLLYLIISIKEVLPRRPMNRFLRHHIKAKPFKVRMLKALSSRRSLHGIKLHHFHHKIDCWR